MAMGMFCREVEHLLTSKYIYAGHSGIQKQSFAIILIHIFGLKSTFSPCDNLCYLSVTSHINIYMPVFPFLTICFYNEPVERNILLQYIIWRGP